MCTFLQKTNSFSVLKKTTVYFTDEPKISLNTFKYNIDMMNFSFIMFSHTTYLENVERLKITIKMKFRNETEE